MVVGLPPPLSFGVLAPRKAWRLLQGESPCRARASHPPVSSLASMAESWRIPRRTRWMTRRQRILSAVGVTAHPEVLVQLRNTLVADAEGLNAHRRPHKRIRVGEDAQVRRSPQAAACRERDVDELGRPQRLLPQGNSDAGSTAHEAQQGKPGHRTMLEPKRPYGTLSQAGGSTMKGKARRRPLGRLLTHRTPRGGKPRTRGRT